jgi:hypothetical protein
MCWRQVLSRALGRVEVDHPEHEQALVDRAQLLEQHAVPRQLGERLVEARIELRELFAFARGPTRMPFQVSRSASSSLRADRVAREPLDDVQLDRGAQVVQLLDVAQVELPHRVAAVLHLAHETVRHERAQRFAHRAAADAELAAQAFLGQPMLGRVLPADDPLLQRADDRRGSARKGGWSIRFSQA